MYKNDLSIIQSHVGNITEDDLKYVEAFVSDKLSVYVPSIGQCQYAIRPSHSHPAYSFILNFNSSGPLVKREISCDSDSFIFSAMSPGVLHEEPVSENFNRYIIILVDKEYFNSIYHVYSSNNPPVYDWHYFTVKSDILFLLKSFMAEYELKSPNYKTVLDNLAYIISCNIIRSLLGFESRINSISNRIEIAKTIEYMHENFSRKLNVQDMAELSNMSQSHFTRTFKKEVGTSPADYLIKIRIDKAKQYLRNTDKNITEIALECGFNSTSHFSTSFLRLTGQNPKDYKHLLKE